MTVTSFNIATPTPPHIACALVLVRLFPGGLNREAPTPVIENWHIRNAKWLEKMLGMVAREALQLYEPITYEQLKQEVEYLSSFAPDPNDDVVKGIQELLGLLPNVFSGVQAAFEYIDAIPEIYIEREEDGPQGHQRIMATSPLGIFARRIFLGFKVLNFAESVQLGRDVVAWCIGAGGNGVGTKGKGKERVRGGINKVAEVDDTIDNRLWTLQTYQKSLEKGDYSLALHTMAKFYDYRFPNNDKGLHQHALLNLASFHYSTGGLEVAKQAVEEAIKVARAAGDRVCLQNCLSLSKRITLESSAPVSSILAIAQPPHPSDTQPTPNSTPLDELHSIPLHLSLGASLPSSYARIYRAMGRQEILERARESEIPVPGEMPRKEEESKEEASGVEGEVEEAMAEVVRSGLWEMFGSASLATMHEDIAFQCPAGSRDVDLTILINRSQRLCKRSRADEALSILLEPYVTEGMTLANHHKWSEAVWDVLEIDASRRDDSRSLEIIHASRIPAESYRQFGAGGPLRTLAHPDQEIKLDYFDRHLSARPRRGVDKLGDLMAAAREVERDGPAPRVALVPLLSAVHTAAELGLWATWRRAKVMLADVLSRTEGNLNPTRSTTNGDGDGITTLLGSAEQEIRPIWDQLLRSEDDDLICTAGWILARASLKKSSDDALLFAHTALLSARRLRSRSNITKISQLLAMIYAVRGDVSQRDEYAKLWIQARDGIYVERRYSIVGSPSAGLGFGMSVPMSRDGTGSGSRMSEDSGGPSGDPLTLEIVMQVREIITKVGVKASSAWVT